MTKPEARALAKRLRAACTPQQLHAWGAQMAARAAALDAWALADTVFCFVPLPDEPDTLPLLQAALAAGKRLCVPRVAPDGLEAVPLSRLSALRRGAWGIREPADGAGLPIGALGEACLAIVPCLAADRHGVRLGRGGGYYDRFLAGYRGRKLLLCPQALLLDALPCEAWDIRFAPDEILTEKGLLSMESEG